MAVGGDRPPTRRLMHGGPVASAARSKVFGPGRGPALDWKATTGTVKELRMIMSLKRQAIRVSDIRYRFKTPPFEFMFQWVLGMQTNGGPRSANRSTPPAS
jgi:hypothetical protein